jgi:hypothetical protein
MNKLNDLLVHIEDNKEFMGWIFNITQKEKLRIRSYNYHRWLFMFSSILFIKICGRTTT